MKRIHHGCLDIHYRRDNRIGDIIQIKETLDFGRRELLVDEVVDNLPFVRHKRHFSAAVSLVNTQIHLPWTI